MASMANDMRALAGRIGLAFAVASARVVRALRLARARPARRGLDARAPSSWPAWPSARWSWRRSPPARCADAGACCARNAWFVLLFGAVPVAGAQFAYFSAVERMDVGPALLIEYTAPAAVVVWLWLRHGERPGPLTVAGAGTRRARSRARARPRLGRRPRSARRAVGADRDGLRRVLLRARRDAAPRPAAGGAGRRRPGEPARSCSPLLGAVGILADGAYGRLAGLRGQRRCRGGCRCSGSASSRPGSPTAPGSPPAAGSAPGSPRSSRCSRSSPA